MNFKILQANYERVIKKYEIDRYAGVVDFRDKLNDIINDIPPDAVEVYHDLDISTSYGYYDSLEVNICVDVSYWIPLTDEMKAKKAEEAKVLSDAARKAAKEKREKKKLEELALLEKLKAKYEKR